MWDLELSGGVTGILRVLAVFREYTLRVLAVFTGNTLDSEYSKYFGMFVLRVLAYTRGYVLLILPRYSQYLGLQYCSCPQ